MQKSESNLSNRTGDREVVNMFGKQIWSHPHRANPTLWLEKVMLPSYPVPAFLTNRYGLQVDCNRINDKANKYLTYQFNRLLKARTNPKLFFVIGMSLIYRSRSFRVSLLNRSMKGWYQNTRLERIVYIFHKIFRMRDRTDVKTTRFYVPKSNGQLRPIGSPKDTWKIILAGWAWLMSLYQLDNRNYAYTPGKGSYGCWIEILKDVVNQKYIYEFDLSKCFNSIRLQGLREGLDYMQLNPALYKSLSLESILRDLKVPENVITILIKFNKNTPKLGDKDVIDLEDPELWEKVNDPQEQIKLIRKRGLTKPGSPGLLQSNNWYGFTQGSPLSPILTIMCLEKWRPLWLSPWRTTLYADDGLFSTSQDYIDLGGGNHHPWPVRDPLDHKWNSKNEVSFDLGVKFNREKSGWVKFDDKWLKPLTFLGATYNPDTQSLSNGEIDIKVSNLTVNGLKKLVGKSYSGTTSTEWDWVYKKDSLLHRLHHRERWFYKLWYFIRIFLYSGYKKWDNNLPIKEASTICCGLLLHGLDRRGPLVRKVGTKRRS